MITVCQNCTCRFQVDDKKAPSGSFTVVCPKCRTIVISSVTTSATELSAMAVGKSPSTSHPRFQRAKPAPLFRMDSGADEATSSVPAPGSIEANELALTLIKLLRPEKIER